MTRRPAKRRSTSHCTRRWGPPAGTGWQLVVGDDTALPAIAAILESASAPATTHAYVSVTDASAVLPLTTRAGTTVTWLPRDGGSGSGDDHGASLVSAVRGASLPSGPGYVWLAAEQSVARNIRAHLVHDRGMDRERVYFSGYWSRGRAEGE
ncbi:siderophore-interacting protein [Streptomyces tendae]|uniref:siderophore-interacting protein n=1 Tax=Streptomyces tendae TaxID=1932 RepID=UPI00133079B8|nr:siderophore-interacting protein [Streptomyces tendae]